jgi:hypothetical protein
MFNSIVLVSVNEFSQGALDKNGKIPVILNVVAGKAPNRNVISGTVAERAGFEVGKSYLASVRETEANEYGRQFVWNKLSEASVIDIIKGQKELGAAQIMNVNASASMEHDPEAAAREELAGN